jgi:metal-sulfur cluster biosynthetic enzyme
MSEVELNNIGLNIVKLSMSANVKIKSKQTK